MISVDPRLLALRDLLPGQVLRGSGGVSYHVRERVGEGGQGWVFTAAWDEPTGYLVIVKVLRPDAASPESLSRFEREAQVLRMLGQSSRPNPHIVRFFDHGTASLPGPSGGTPVELRFTVLEYVRGTTLEQVLSQSRGSGLPLERTRRIARQVALALEDVHAHKVVHRDLKPSNVLLANDAGVETAKVTDFGLVKLVDMGLGKTTALAGASLGYAPPEQFEQGNRRVNPRTDVFSYAAMVFEMLTGIKAFPYGEQENPLVIVTRLLNGPRPSLSGSRGALPQELSSRADLVERLNAVLQRATAAEPNERHANITDLWAALDPILRAAAERRSFSPVGLAAAPSPDVAAPAAQKVTANNDLRTAETVEVAQKSGSGGTETQLTSPAAWKWRVCVPPVRAGAVRVAIFEPSGDHAVALGPTGLVRWEGTAWTRLPPTAELDVRSVRGLAWLNATDMLAYGARGLALRFAPGAGFEPWDVPDKEITFLGAYVDPQGATVTLVGERPSRKAARAGATQGTMGTLAQFTRGKLTLLTDATSATRLRGVTRLRSGALVACGDWGALVRLEMGVPEHVGSICGGHLHSIAALADGSAVTVGAGGHALSLSPSLQAQLEAVQTTRDLLTLTLDARGVAWAGSAQARLLRRTAGSWVRMSGELGLQSSVVSLWATPRTVRAICDDGAVIEGIVAA
jgi:serine/threonine protein kinase